MGAKGKCKFEQCSRDAVGKGYCRLHYRKWKHGGLPKPRYKTCHEPGCHRRQERAGRCAEHQKKQPASEAKAS